MPTFPSEPASPKSSSGLVVVESRERAVEGGQEGYSKGIQNPISKSPTWEDQGFGKTRRGLAGLSSQRQNY